MPFRCFLLLLLLARAVAARTPADTTARLTPEQLRADFTRFRTALHEAHPALYRYTPKATFDSLLAATEARLGQPMTQHEFYVAMIPLLVALRDGHIKWLVPNRDQHYPFFADRLFPLNLYFRGHRAWVVGNYGRDSLPAGAEVVAINGQPISQVIDTLLPSITFADGRTLTGKYQDLNHFFSGYYATYIAAPAVHRITYQRGDTQTTVSVPAVPLAAIRAYEKKRATPQKTPRLTIDDSTRTAWLTIERFWTEAGEQRFSSFLSDAFQTIKNRQCQQLVLDLRGNEGGEENYGVQLYRYLAQKPFRYYDHISVHQKKAFSFPAWTSGLYRALRWLVVKKRPDGYVFTAQRGLKRQKPQSTAFPGTLYVLIDGGSFSVTTEFAARVHADGRGLFVGQETAGAYEGNNSGLFAITQLPNSHIDLGIPMFGFYMADLPPNLEKGQGIRPNQVIMPTIEDVLTHADPVKQYVRQRIRSGGHPSMPLSPIKQ